MWNGFDCYFYLDRIYRIIRNYFACGEGLFGRRPHYPNDPVDHVQLFSLKKESIPFFSNYKVFSLIKPTARSRRLS